MPALENHKLKLQPEDLDLMKQKTRFIKTERRSFLKGAAVAGGAAVIAPSAAVAMESQPEVEPVATGDKGYEENDYIRKYYEIARF